MPTANTAISLSWWWRISRFFPIGPRWPCPVTFQVFFQDSFVVVWDYLLAGSRLSCQLCCLVCQPILMWAMHWFHTNEDTPFFFFSQLGASVDMPTVQVCQTCAAGCLSTTTANKMHMMIMRVCTQMTNGTRRRWYTQLTLLLFIHSWRPKLQLILLRRDCKIWPWHLWRPCCSQNQSCCYVFVGSTFRILWSLNMTCQPHAQEIRHWQPLCSRPKSDLLDFLMDLATFVKMDGGCVSGWLWTRNVLPWFTWHNTRRIHDSWPSKANTPCTSPTEVL